MTRYRLKIAYDGTPFHGWQRQKNAITVEEVLTNALTTMTGSHRPIFGASRTDAGVHALEQVAAFDYNESRFNAPRFYRGLNALVPKSVAITHIEETSQNFHPRHNARGKIYRYLIWTQWHRSPLLANTSWHRRQRLNITAMHKAAQHLVGIHDFTSFRASNCDANSPIREMYQISVQEIQPALIQIEVVGSAFLKHMVRTIAGTLVIIGANRQKPDWMAALLNEKDRTKAGMKAPACGLTLHKIFYPDFPWIKKNIRSKNAAPY